MVSTKPFCLIIIALLVLLLSAAPNTQGQDSDWFELEPETCDWYGPPNGSTCDLPTNNNQSYWVGWKSLYKSLHKQPVSHNLTASIDKVLPAGKAVIQMMPAQGIDNTTCVDLCSLTIGGCPIQPGYFMVNFDLYIKLFNQIQFSMFAENGELLLCIFFEESDPTQNDVISAHTSVRAE